MEVSLEEARYLEDPLYGRLTLQLLWRHQSAFRRKCAKLDFALPLPLHVELLRPEWHCYTVLLSADRRVSTFIMKTMLIRSSKSVHVSLLNLTAVRLSQDFDSTFPKKHMILETDITSRSYNICMQTCSGALHRFGSRSAWRRWFGLEYLNIWL